MLTIFRQTFWNSKGQILGWGISLALLGVFLLRFYDTMAETGAELQRMIESYPPEMMAFFGDMNEIFTPHGYLQIEFFSYMPIVIGVYALLVGSGLLAGDEESGVLDLVLAHPISRTGLFVGRLLAFAASMAAVLLVTYVGFLISMQGTSLDIPAGELALPFLSLLSVLVFFGTLALLLSLVLPSRRAAAMLTGLLLVTSYFITSLRQIDDSLDTAAKFSPLSYYQGGNALVEMNWTWFFGLLGVSALFAMLAWQLFERRDIRVGGEGGWRIGRLRAKRQPAA